MLPLPPLATIRRWLRRPLPLSIALLLAVMLVGTLGYVYIEHWSWSDALWMVVITLTTIGYGEVRPLNDEGRLWTLGVIMSGVSIGAYALAGMTAAFIEGDLLKQWARNRRIRKVRSLEGHYIVVGAGRLGMAVIEEITAAGGEVCVIESDAKRIAALEHAGILVIEGDGSNDEVLRAAGIERARGMAVAVPSGAQAIFVTLSARHLSPALPISTRASDAEEATKARRAGATTVVSPYRMGGWRMAHGLTRPESSNFLDLATLSAHAELSIEELVIPPGSPTRGQTLRSLNIRDRFGLLVVAIRREGGELVPAPDAGTKVGAGDVLILVGRPEGVSQLAAIL